MRYRTDLAVEIKENLDNSGINPGEDDGIKVNNYTIDEDIKVTEVEILNIKGEVLMGKPCGKYITIEADGIAEEKEGIKDKVARALAKELEKFVRHSYYLKTLIIGLGNEKVTPDSLGPKALSKVKITRHLFKIFDCEGDEEYSNVAGLAPGVTAVTGIETADLIEKLVTISKPDALIVIDALAAKNINRLSTTIQIANTGISPGSGMGNNRKEISEKNLGIPVIAIGVPTVIDAKTVVIDAADGLNISEEQVKEYFAQKGDSEFDLVVTSTDIDIIIESFSEIISKAINICLHPGIYF